MSRVLIPVPASGFDPTEAAVPWRVLRGLGHEVLFATPDGARAHADPLMLSGEGLDPWGWIPALAKITLAGRFLRANQEGRDAYRAMREDRSFQQPMRWDAVTIDDFDGLLLPGGHRADGMREYLESPVLQSLVVQCFRAGKPVGAICHGVLLVARSIDPATSRSVLFGRKTTALTWRLERAAARLGRLVRFWDPTYYRTYPEPRGQPAGYMSVQQDVTRALEQPSDFIDVAPDAPHRWRKTSGAHRDTLSDWTPAWVVRDGRYISARWPGDAHRFAVEFASLLR